MTDSVTLQISVIVSLLGFATTAGILWQKVNGIYREVNEMKTDLKEFREIIMKIITK